jgi:hypothetical protein
MDFINFPEANAQRTAPEGMEATVGTLPVYTDGQQSISCWLPNQQERDAIAAGLPVWLGVDGGQPPVWVSATKPDMPAVVHKPSPEMLRALAYIASLLPAPETLAAGLRDGAALAAEQPALRGPNGEPIKAGKQYYIGGVQAQCDHYAGLVEAYQERAQAGVVAYLQPYAAFLPQEVITLSA